MCCFQSLTLFPVSRSLAVTGVRVLGMGVTLKPAHALGQPSGGGGGWPCHPALPAVLGPDPTPAPRGCVRAGRVSHRWEGAPCAGGPCVSRQGCRVSAGTALKRHEAGNPSCFQEKAEAAGESPSLVLEDSGRSGCGEEHKGRQGLASRRNLPARGPTVPRSPGCGLCTRGVRGQRPGLPSCTTF